MSLNVALIVSAVMISWGVCEGKSGVLITAPKIWLLGSEEKICITSLGVQYPLTVTANLTVSKYGDGNGSHLAEMETTINTPSECFTFPLDSRKLRSYSESAMGFSVAVTNSDTGYSFQGGHLVGVQKQSLLTFVQTDKPVYKPGQTVKFRILTVRPDLLPHKDSIDAVFVEDPKGARMMQWTDVEVRKTQGLGDFEMPLSPEPVQGQWKVIAQIGSVKEEHTFRVEEYVLPKYEITVKPPSYIMTDDDYAEGEVCAKYTYGEPVKGEMTLQACFSGFYYGRKQQCVNLTAEIDGCAPFAVDIEELGVRSNDASLWNAKIHFQANVTERGTGVELMSQQASVKVERNPFTLGFVSSPGYFKPGIVYHGTVSVTKPDNTPGVGEVVEINVDDYSSDLHFAQNYTSNSKGEVDFTLPIPVESTSTESLAIRATMPMYNYQRLSETYWRWSPNTPRSYLSVKQWFSPSGSHVQITPIEGTTPCKAEMPVEISYTTSDNIEKEFHFQVISGGDIVYTGKQSHTYTGPIITSKPRPSTTTTTTTTTTTSRPPVAPQVDPEGHEIMVDHRYPYWPDYKPPKGTPAPPPKGTVASFTFHVPVTAEMSGVAKLLVFYVLPDGEVVADSSEFEVDECVKNEVKLDFLDTQKYPGEKTKLRLQADSGSLCSVGVVDKSVQLMGQNTQLTLRKVFDMLMDYDIKEWAGPWVPDNYCRNKMAGEDDDTYIPPPPMPVLPRPRGKRSIYPGGGYYSNYVDSKQAFQQAGMFSMGDVVVETRPCQRRTVERMYYSEIMPGSNGGGAPGPGGAVPEIPVDSVMPDSGNTNAIEPPPKQVELRNYFPETWLWDLHKVRGDGEVTISTELPHTITEWVGNAFCTNAQTGLGVAPPATIRAFQPFFVSFTLPYSVVRGEKVNLPVTVFNYLSECMVVELMLKDTDGIRISRSDRRTEICVCGQTSETHRFRITARDLGEVNITVKAKSVENNGVCGNGLSMTSEVGVRDAVTRPLLVEPEGREEEASVGAYVCPEGGASVTEAVTLTLPPDVVPDSARAFINVIGDVMGPSLSDLDKLLALPTGCGEQNMLKFAPNIFVMQYLEATNQLEGELKEKATGFLTTGYQRELSYRHADGAYSAFGDRDPEGSMWLTAFVVKSFAQARPYIYIDERDLNVSIAWFKQRQLENGCFPQVGKVLHKAMKGGLSGGGSEASLTAYVLVAMLEAGISREDPSVLSAIRCLDIQTVAEDDTYTTALLAYAYSVYDKSDGRYLEMMDRLWEYSITEDGTTHWEVPRPPPPTADPNGWTYIHHTSPADVETTAYAMMAVANGDEDLITTAMPIVKWLTSKRNSHGGFGSTQDTVVGLQALAIFASEVYGDSLDLRVAVAGDDGNHDFTVDNDNSLLLQQVMVAAPNNLQYSITGEGCVFVQTNLRYNVYNVSRPDVKDAFELKVTPKRVRPSNNCRQRLINVCAGYTGPDGQSNMAVVTVKMVSGWMPNLDSVHMLLQDTALMLKRFEIEKNFVNFYFDELTSELRCFEFQIDQEIEVDNPQPALVHVYDYYETSLSAMSQYKLRHYCGTKEEIPFDYGPNPDGEQRRVRPEFPDFIDVETGDQDSCPDCLTEAPEESVLIQYVCQAEHAYKSYVRRGSRRPLRVVYDVRALEKVSYSVKYTLPEGCECETLTQSGSSRLLLFTKDTAIIENAQKASQGELLLDGSSKVVPLASNAVERKLRRHVKRGRC